MIRNKRKGKSLIKHLIIIASIGMLGMTGVSYAYWTDSVNTYTSVAAGNINAYITGRDTTICKGFILTPDYNDVTRFRMGIGPVNTYNIIPFTIKNSGTIPVKINPQEITVKFYTNDRSREDIDDKGGLQFQISSDKQLNGDNQFVNNNKIMVDKDKDVVIFIKVSTMRPGNYYCTLSIPYTQFNGNSTKNENGEYEYEGWKKELNIKFDKINVSDK